METSQQTSISRRPDGRHVNNGIYHSLGERWYAAKDDPVALLRAESRTRNPWVHAQIERFLPRGRRRVLDVGCGGGFLSNDLGQRGYEVTGIDVAEESLAVARSHDSTGTVRYQSGDALALPFQAESFDAVCAMDFLEHVEDPGRVIVEASRVLAPGGLFFFSTFNRNWLSWLIVIKGVEWFVANAPSDMHVLRLFLKPEEATTMCQTSGMEMRALSGLAPNPFRAAFWRMLFTHRVDDDFEFRFVRSTAIGYIGVAQK